MEHTLTKIQAFKLCEKGVRIRFEKKRANPPIKGEFDPSTLDVVVYLSHLDPLKVDEPSWTADRDITLLYGLLQARNWLFSREHQFAALETALLNADALLMYLKKSEVLEYVKELYGIR